MRSSRLRPYLPRPAALLVAVAAGTVLALASASPLTEGTSPAGQVGHPVEVVAVPLSAERGDDNRDGRIDEDESGWDCRTMGNRICGPRTVPAECRGVGSAMDLCVTVASRPPYGWTNADGSRTDNPDGRTLISDLDEMPGSPEFEGALAALDAEWRQQH
ncbi:hypothetical protein [Streptomyces sp. NPDC056399]|uniref:hypothetical protein n=1 Tax=Streptomyces sp. NPDC056399 TaxID=3345807 RepID=UPI0035DB2ED6